MTEEKVKPEEIDLSDLSLQSEGVEVNPDGDAFASPAPPPERDSNGKVIQYRVKLSHSDGVGVYKKGSAKTGEFIGTASVIGKIIDPGGDLDGVTLRGGYVSTLNNRQGISTIAHILRVLGKPSPVRTSHVEMARLFKDTIDGEPECLVEIEWSAYSEEDVDPKTNKGRTVLRGMKRWPKDATGKHVGEMIYQKTGETVRARAEISKYLPVTS